MNESNIVFTCIIFKRDNLGIIIRASLLHMIGLLEFNKILFTSFESSSVVSRDLGS